ncbi:hypothetical protein PpBr36_03898 [Pyricularia pennisetigena]|uniref:hypothetical protein n=1 Tax=Pyricularia pennisetigena TaxID=1578925 RepID=UPI001152FFD0|nr:hypothetical protein PpBr36_03898 [Pyricularia pennisetigena]TLS30814.1 hypothetical protein PpBr36_03898 [Pyricularia pennisetigena]
MSFTRISWVPVKSDVDDAALAPLASAGAALSKQPGIGSIYQGRIVDGTPSLYALTTWASEDAAKAAESSAEFGEIEGILAGIIDTSSAKPYTNLVNLSKPFDSIASPVTRIIAIFLPGSVDKAAFAAKLEEMDAAIAAANLPGYKGSVNGWAVEQIEHPSVPGGPANVFLSITGWDSIEASAAAATAPGMSENHAALAAFGGIFEVHHVSLTKA